MSAPKPDAISMPDATTSGYDTRFGFVWGPLEVTRCSYIEGRGFVVMVNTGHKALEIHVSPKGQKIKAFPTDPWRTEAEMEAENG